jgi:hypothetical protein
MADKVPPTQPQKDLAPIPSPRRDVQMQQVAKKTIKPDTLKKA